jgi:AcrR family transcriptional regulator
MKIHDPEFRALVLRKAIELIVRRGVKGLNMADLARASGLAKNTLFKIIGSKERLIEAVVIYQMEHSLSLLTTIIREEGEYRAAAGRILEELPLFLAEGPRVPASEIFLQYPAIHRTAEEFQKKAATAVIAFIRKGQKEGHIRDDVTPEFLSDLIRGIVDHYSASGLRGEALKDALADAFHCLREGVRRGEW